VLFSFLRDNGKRSCCDFLFRSIINSGKRNFPDRASYTRAARKAALSGKMAGAVASRETMSDGTYYTVLGIPETATQDEIKRAYRDSIEAYQVLSDSAQRSSYDQQLAQHRQQDAPARPAPPKAAATPPPLALTLPPNARPLPRAREPVFNWWVNWGFLAGILLSVAIWYMLFVVVFDGSNDPQLSQSKTAVATGLHQAQGSPDRLSTPKLGTEPPRTEYPWRPEDIASYCITHPTSFYGAPGTAWGVSCSDWAHQNQLKR